MKQQVDTGAKCLQEMKAVSIFNRILCDVYVDNIDNNEHTNNNNNDNIGICDAKIGKNPFGLSHKIYCKMQEIINHIKTQLKLREITGKMYMDQMIIITEKNQL